MNQKLIEEAQRQCWIAWEQRFKSDNGTLNRYCKVLCDIVPPDIPPTTSCTQKSEIDVAVLLTSNHEALREHAKSPPPNTLSGWWIAVAWGCFFFALYVAGQLEASQAGSGRTMLGWLFGLGVISVVIYINIGSSAKQTSLNIVKMAKSILIFLVIVFVLGGLGTCINSDSSNPEGSPDSWNRR